MRTGLIPPLSSPHGTSPARESRREAFPSQLSQTSESQALGTRSGNGGLDSDGLAHVFKQVSDLALRLGIDSPNYRIDPDEDMPNYFSGRPVFKSGLMPPDLGVVSGVLGKRQAKMQIAEKVLEWLQKEQEGRHTTFNSLFALDA